MALQADRRATSRIIYREEGSRVIILNIMRGERSLRLSVLAVRSKLPNK
jgi:hypothetical protein